MKAYAAISDGLDSGIFGDTEWDLSHNRAVYSEMRSQEDVQPLDINLAKGTPYRALSRHSSVPRDSIHFE